MSGMGAKGGSPFHDNSLSDPSSKVSRQRRGGLVGGLGKNLNLTEHVARIDKFIPAGANRLGQRENVRGLGCIAFADILVVRRTCKNSLVPCALEREGIRLLQIEAGGVGGRCEAER